MYIYFSSFLVADSLIFYLDMELLFKHRSLAVRCFEKFYRNITKYYLIPCIKKKIH